MCFSNDFRAWNPQKFDHDTGGGGDFQPHVVQNLSGAKAEHPPLLVKSQEKPLQTLGAV